MKVKGLIAELVTLSGELEVILQKDGEGNSFSPLEGMDDNTIYVPDSTWAGDVYPLAWSAEDADMSEEEWKEFKSQPTCVLLYPVN